MVSANLQYCFSHCKNVKTGNGYKQFNKQLGNIFNGNDYNRDPYTSQKLWLRNWTVLNNSYAKPPRSIFISFLKASKSRHIFSDYTSFFSQTCYHYKNKALNVSKVRCKKTHILITLTPHQISKAAKPTNIAPIREAAYCVITHSTRLGLQIPTRSPGTTPSDSKPAARSSTYKKQLRIVVIFNTGLEWISRQ